MKLSENTTDTCINMGFFPGRIPEIFVFGNDLKVDVRTGKAISDGLFGNDQQPMVAYGEVKGIYTDENGVTRGGTKLNLDSVFVEEGLQEGTKEYDAVMKELGYENQSDITGELEWNAYKAHLESQGTIVEETSGKIDTSNAIEYGSADFMKAAFSLSDVETTNLPGLKNITNAQKLINNFAKEHGVSTEIITGAMLSANNVDTVEDLQKLISEGKTLSTVKGLGWTDGFQQRHYGGNGQNNMAVYPMATMTPGDGNEYVSSYDRTHEMRAQNYGVANDEWVNTWKGTAGLLAIPGVLTAPVWAPEVVAAAGTSRLADSAFGAGTNLAMYMLGDGDKTWQGALTSTIIGAGTGFAVSPFTGTMVGNVGLNAATRFGAGSGIGMAGEFFSQLSNENGINTGNILWSGFNYGIGTAIGGMNAGKNVSYWLKSGLGNSARTAPSIFGSWMINKTYKYYGND